MACASDYKAYAEAGFRDYCDYSDCVEYVNQEDDYGDCLRGEWFYGDDDARVIYSGTFGNYNSPGADHYTYAERYDSEEEYRAALAEWKAKPEYLDSDDNED